MDRYACYVCRYIYEPENGDQKKGMPGGTSFEGLPLGWVCPVCGAPRNMFARGGSLGTDTVQGFFW